MSRSLPVAVLVAAACGLFTIVTHPPRSSYAADSFLDAETAGPDFATQGEYATDGWGLQVMARGAGQFDSMLFTGGLPGAGWDGKTKRFATGKTADQNTTLKGKDLTIEIAAGLAHVTVDGKIAALPATKRVSPTLGKEPPAGAKVLFNGTNVDSWDKGRMTADHLLMVGTQTAQKWKDYQLHLEFRSPFMPASLGQQRGNSGMYLGGQYECQILDSFGLEGADNECGGIYQNARPNVNMCLPPLSWQTYDVDFTAAKFGNNGDAMQPAVVTIRHNGVVIHENLPIKPTPGGVQNDQKPGPIYLQDHGDQVHFKNIWIVEK